MNTNGKVVTAVAVGIGIGAVLGILFAPFKGSKTRKKIKKQGIKLADEVKGQYFQGKEMLKKEFNDDMVKSAREKVENYV